MDYHTLLKFKTTPFFGGAFLSGDIIEIEHDVITLKRNLWFSKTYFKVTIPLSNVVNVNILKTRLGANILIESHTNSQIESKGFRYSTACKLKSLIMHEIHNHYSTT